MARNVIIGAYEIGIKNFINIATACVYPSEKYDELLTEDMAVTGSFEKENEGYSLGKATGLLMCKYISEKNSDFFYKTLIPCNVYGVGCKASFSPSKAHILASAIKKICLAKKENLTEVQIWGDGQARREFIYAGDLAKIILFVAENLEKIPDILNVGVGKDYSVNECYETVAKLLNYEGKFVHDLTKPSGIKQRLLNVERLHRIGLRAETSLTDGLKATIDYYLKNF